MIILLFLQENATLRVAHTQVKTRSPPLAVFNPIPTSKEKDYRQSVNFC